jgi:hypothetical protein
MSMKVAIDGRSFFGGYEVQCECGDRWKGTGEELRHGFFSPALPIAEAVVHMRLCHPGVQLDVHMTADFESWLASYWEWANMREASQLTVPR